MSSRLAQALLLATLAATAAPAQVEKAESGAETAGGGRPALAGASLGASPAPVALVVAPLSAAPAPSASPAAASAAPAALPAAAPAPVERPAGVGPEPAATAAERSGAEGASADDRDSARGREVFDAAAPKDDESPGLWARLKSFAGLGERIPAWPGAAGERLRVGKRTFTLEAPLAQGVWRTSAGAHEVKLAPPGRSIRAEAEALRSLEGTDIPRARLVAADSDGRALVKEHFDDEDAGALLARGFETRHVQGWAELAARLIRAGVTAELSPSNLTWQRWGTRWILADARGVRPAGPGEVLEALLNPAARRAGVEPGGFLAAVRARLGPDSPEWEKARAALRPSDLAALEARDRALPPAPELVFGPAEPQPFPDEAGPARRIAKALGYDPLAVKSRRMLHNDPGKLNTLVFSVQPPGKTPVAVKIAEWPIIRRELAVRRVIRRWFGRWFDSPSAFGVERGLESYLVMELKAGSPDHYSSKLTMEQRAALAILVHAFGIGDMNPGNVLFPAGGKPVLLDFEQALTRRTPVAGRLPDEGIALEMPWASRFEVNRAEDYQPAARAWRALLARPESRTALLEDFRASGYSAEEAAALLNVVERNTADLDWTIANDVEFVNQFSEGRGKPSGRRGPS